MIYWPLRSGEFYASAFPRADSLLQPIRTVPDLADGDHLARLGVTLRGHSQPLYSAVQSTLMRILLLAQFFPPDIGGEGAPRLQPAGSRLLSGDTRLR